MRKTPHPQTRYISHNKFAPSNLHTFNAKLKHSSTYRRSFRRWILVIQGSLIKLRLRMPCFTIFKSIWLLCHNSSYVGLYLTRKIPFISYTDIIWPPRVLFRFDDFSLLEHRRTQYSFIRYVGICKNFYQVTYRIRNILC